MVVKHKLGFWKIPTGNWYMKVLVYWGLDGPPVLPLFMYYTVSWINVLQFIWRGKNVRLETQGEMMIACELNTTATNLEFDCLDAWDNPISSFRILWFFGCKCNRLPLIWNGYNYINVLFVNSFFIFGNARILNNLSGPQFFMQAKSICPSDPLVYNELGVVAYNMKE